MPMAKESFIQILRLLVKCSSLQRGALNSLHFPSYKARKQIPIFAGMTERKHNGHSRVKFMVAHYNTSN